VLKAEDGKQLVDSIQLSDVLSPEKPPEKPPEKSAETQPITEPIAPSPAAIFRKIGEHLSVSATPKKGE